MTHHRKAGLALAVLLATMSSPGLAGEGPASTGITTISEHLMVYHGPTNVGIVRDGTKALLINCGEGSVATVLTELGITSVEEFWFTHHYRDLACGAPQLMAEGSRVRVPEAERTYFENVSAYWQDPRNRWHLYNQHLDHWMLAESIPVDATLRDGQMVAWGPAKITAIATPGYTDGSLSYLIETDGRRVIFCGDTIYDAGQVRELWGLQKRLAPEERPADNPTLREKVGPNGWPSDYQWFLGARQQLEQSLERIKAARPDILVPAHGRIITDPGGAMDLLGRRLDAAYDHFLAVSSLRYHYPQIFAETADKPGYLPIRPGKPAPDCLQHLPRSTTWLLISQDKAALVMDCANASVVQAIQAMLAKGEIRSVEGLWVTHYHDDHVDGIPAFREAFPDCPVITDRSVAEIIGNPMAWRLPCISPVRVRVDRVTKEGESWSWHEFKLTAYHFPGQTLHHAGLFVEGQGGRMLFAGDSFSMAGIDDYCMPNRNWVGPGVGFDRCLALVEQLRPTHLLNAHIDLAFDFTHDECRFMRNNLAEREKLFGELIPWDNMNYGMDESWVRCAPYEQKVTAGEEMVLDVVITNHSSGPRTASCRPILPRAWDGRGTNPAWPGEADPRRAGTWPTAVIPAKSEGRIRLTFPVPGGVKPGRYVIPIDVNYDRQALPQFTEAICTVATRSDGS